MIGVLAGTTRCLQQRHQLVPVGHARRVRRVTLVRAQMRQPNRLCHPLELAVVAHGNDQAVVGRGERGVGDDRGVCVTEARRYIAGDQVRERLQ